MVIYFNSRQNAALKVIPRNRLLLEMLCAEGRTNGAPSLLASAAEASARVLEDNTPEEVLRLTEAIKAFF